jgi:hypothetical protein
MATPSLIVNFLLGCYYRGLIWSVSAHREVISAQFQSPDPGLTRCLYALSLVDRFNCLDEKNQQVIERARAAFAAKARA